MTLIAVVIIPHAQPEEMTTSGVYRSFQLDRDQIHLVIDGKFFKDLQVITGGLVLAIYGFAGVVRAGFWARAYRALGGLSAADHVPGLR